MSCPELRGVARSVKSHCAQDPEDIILHEGLAEHVDA